LGVGIQSTLSKTFHYIIKLFCKRSISEMEACLAYYPKTFFLDHAQERDRFPKDFNTQVIQRILSFF
ncbi:hypothetical protein QUA54_32990, partial [Microcoleus sp. MOSTC5]